jgi:hypothetical protein
MLKEDKKMMKPKIMFWECLMVKQHRASDLLQEADENLYNEKC